MIFIEVRVQKGKSQFQYYCPRFKLHSDDHLEEYFNDLEVIDLKMAPPISTEENTENEDLIISSRRKKHKSNDYLLFNTDALKFISVDSKCMEKYTWLGERLRLTFKMMRSDSKLIRTMLHGHGFMQCSSKNPNVNVIWSGAPMKNIRMRDLMPWQRLNQFPRSTELTKKDRLYENIERSKSIFGTPFDFIPEFYVTPRENKKMTEAFDRLNQEIIENGGEFCFPGEFIVKPTNSRQGKGIFFANKMEDIPTDGPLLVSRYLSDPLLVNKHKFDLRIYVAVTSFYPLVCYIYSEGLARLASMPYDSSSSSDSNEFVHLTNYSINKNSDSFVRNESMTSEDLGHKWTLGALLRHLDNEGIDSKLMMIRIEDLIVKSLLSIQNSVATASKTLLKFHGTNFELFGFDVLVDNELKPWLLEVNLSPSLACDAPLDSLIKTRLIADLMNLACIPLIEKKIIDSVSATIKNAISNSGEEPEDIEYKLEMDPKCVKTLKRRPVGIRRSVLNRKIASGQTSLITPNEQKMDQIIRRVNVENERKGDFIRVFPRISTWSLYSAVMEDLGYDDLDQRLYEELFENIEREGSMEKKMRKNEEENEELFHEIMMNAKKYPDFTKIPQNMQEILKPWYLEAGEYTKKITVEGEKYASKLPAIRPTARLRTKSCAEYYEVRRGQLIKKKEVELAQKMASDKENNTN
ncbi:unnamed protein product [Caenorhabditis angaria]|uniref:Tubulin--tyrosine ligase-like protein 5 n=1 Tax=Caenorhabditis angaria TaxID=860376 RepID=A0A9P1N7T6_9PELO|nr:unnamed protein product [Caenorhabditis angaria]